MNSLIKPDANRLHIFHEGRKRRIFVGELSYNTDTHKYEFVYNKKYAHSKNVIPIGPELDLFNLHHQSKKDQLFPSLLDRLPEKANPAYVDYCHAQGISPDEKNPIILLGTIGKRGPSSFVFEFVYDSEFKPNEITRLRDQLGITQHDLALAFDIRKSTLQRLESGESHDFNTLKRLQILLTFPDVALWQLKQTGSRVHKDVLAKLVKYFSHQ